MSYQHFTVSKIERTTQSYLTALAALKATVPPTEVDPPTGCAYVDGIQVANRLAECAEALRKQMRGIKFGTNTRPDITTISKDLHVYFPGDEYTMGCISFGDFALKTNAPFKAQYAVYSRLIANDKFRPDRRQYYMAISNDMKRALKSATKNLRPYSLAEMGDLTVNNMRHSVEMLRSNAAGAVSNARSRVTSSPALFSELARLVDTNYDFVSTELRNFINDWREAVRLRKEEDARSAHAYYVYVKTTGEEQEFHVGEMFDVTKYNNIRDSFASQHVYTAGTLPESIAHKIAALSIVEPGQYVAQVGIRMKDNIFWVHRDAA